MASNSTKQNTTTTTPVTAYGFAKVVNGLLKEAGLKELPAQMFYTYKNKGLLGTEDKPFTAEFANEWTASYILRKQAKEKAASEKAEAELKGETVNNP